MATCDENLDDVLLPHDDRVEVNIHQNETPDSSTLNRSSNRLLVNDKKLLEYAKNIALTNLSEGLSGCIKLTSPGCLTVDMNYISQNICLSLAQLDGLLKLEDLCDVCVIDPDDGDALVWSGVQNCWTNELGAGQASASGVMRERCRFVPITNHSCQSLSAAPAVSNTRQITLDTFDVLEFNSQWNIAPEDIGGFYVVVRNFGRYDSASVSGVSWKIEAQYPDNEFHTVNSHEAWNTDDDGGTAQTVFVPYDHSLSTDGHFKLRFDTENIMAEHFSDENGVPMNFYKVIGAKVCEINSPIFPDFSTTHIKGMVAPGAISVDGYIDENTAADPVYKTWSSETPTALTNTFSGIVPINAPTTALVSELEFVGLLTQNASESDPGTGSGGGNSIVRGYITYDWLDRTIRGHITYNAGGSPATQGTGVFNGQLNEDVSINSLDFSGLVINATTFAQLRRIIKLPVISDATGAIMARNVAYTIRHYNVRNTSRADGRNDIITTDIDYDLTSGDCGNTVVADSTDPVIINLPSSLSGCRFTIAKLNTGNVIIQTDGTDVISDSVAGGNITNSEDTETWATLTVEAVADGVWVIVAGHGTWITS
jgi:hypothetical protein